MNQTPTPVPDDAGFDDAGFADAGFAGVDRALRAFTADVAPPRLPAGDVSYTLQDSAIGRMLLAVRADGTVVASRFAAADADADALLQRLADVVSPRVLRAARPTDEVRRQLDEYLSGRRTHFDVTVDPVLASGFQRDVLTALPGAAGYGQQATYGALARSIGRPTAARAVGAALGANPLCVLLPCHRVVGSSGALTGYAGGTEAKRYLLDLESRAA